MKLSVALCTYNGAKYIEEQILSILNQTMPVDEIVVCDDGSTDETLQIINRIKEKSLVEIRVFCNETTLGVCANFQEAVDLCRGDVIFLSDQDDVWHPHKVKTIVEWFEQHSDKSVVFTNAELINGEGKLATVDMLFDRVGFSPKYRDYFDAGCELAVFYTGNHATGATMAIKGKMVFSQYCNNWSLHDEAIALIAIHEGTLGYIDEPLIQYRLHGSQQVGIPDSVCASEQRFNELCILNPEVQVSRPSRRPSLLSEKFLDYKKFQQQRIEIEHSYMGFVVSVYYVKKYMTHYKKRCFKFMCYDMKKSIKYCFSRVKCVIFKKK